MELQTTIYLVVGITFALYIGIAIWARAGSTSEYYAAGGSVPPVLNGMATAADWMSAASFISMAGLIANMGYGGGLFLTVIHLVHLGPLGPGVVGRPLVRRPRQDLELGEAAAAVAQGGAHAVGAGVAYHANMGSHSLGLGHLDQVGHGAGVVGKLEALGVFSQTVDRDGVLAVGNKNHVPIG